MKKRLAALLGNQGKRVWASTFHAACLKIVQSNPEAVGYYPELGVYDASETKAIIKGICSDLHADYHGVLDKKASKAERRRYTNTLADSARLIGKAFAAEKNGVANLADPSDLYCKACPVWLPEAKARYIQQTKDANKIGFDDLLWLTARLFRENADVLQQWRNKIDFCLVDEYQDTNPTQAEILEALCSQSRQITVVGDPDQSIYGFRHAQPDNFDRLQERFPEARHVVLEQNYRSAMPILNTANALIACNPYREQKRLWSRITTGDKPRHQRYDDLHHEAYSLADAIWQRHAAGVDWSDMAILYRTNRCSASFERALSAEQIPYKVINATAFYARAEIRTAVAYLKAWHNKKDEVSLRRVVNVPSRWVGKITVNKKKRLAVANGTSLWDELAADARQGGTGKTSKGIAAFVQAMESVTGTSPRPVLEKLLERSGYLDEVRSKFAATMEANGGTTNNPVANIMELFAAAGRHGTISEFLEEVTLASQQDMLDEDAPSVSLMTIHGAKGLEFDTVFVTGMGDGGLPLVPREDEDEDEDDTIGGFVVSIEEERRLAFVAFTRAQRYLNLSWNRQIAKSRSRFLNEVQTTL